MSAQESLSIILNQPGFPRARPLSSDSKVGITEERATELINYQRNLEELRNTLSQVDSLLAEPPTPEIAAKCASLLGYVAAIDLPQEVKNQEAGRYPPQVQEQVHRALETQGTSTTRSAEAAAYGTAIMQRVAEEAQVRIQLEAKAAYEESVASYHRNMQAIENDLNNAVELFKNSPYSVEGERKLMESTWEGKEARLREITQHGNSLVTNISNMSPEMQRKALKEWKEETQRMEESRRKHESEAQYYRQLAMKESNPELRSRYMALSRYHGMQASGLAECINRSHHYLQKAENQCYEVREAQMDLKNANSGKRDESLLPIHTEQHEGPPVYQKKDDEEARAFVSAMDKHVPEKQRMASFDKNSQSGEVFDSHVEAEGSKDKSEKIHLASSFTTAVEFSLNDDTNDSRMVDSEVKAPFVPQEKKDDILNQSSNVKDRISSHSAGTVKPDSLEMVHVFATINEFSLG